MPHYKVVAAQPISLHPQHGQIKRIAKGDGERQGGETSRDVYPGEVISVQYTFSKPYLVEVRDQPKARPKAEPVPRVGFIPEPDLDLATDHEE
jgi:hypothetical protein